MSRGQQDASSGNSEYNANAFLIQQMLGRLSTSTLVEVISVTNDGGVEPIGYVDVQPMVNLLDGNNNAEPHGIIYGVPYYRLVGGRNAVIMDPVKGDIGMAAFADHDISSVIANQAPANPGSGRRFSMADALFFGAFRAEAPLQWVRFSEEGIELHSPTQILLDAPNIKMTGAMIDLEATVKISLTAPLISENGA